MARKKIEEIIEVGEGMNVEISGDTIKIKKGEDEVERKIVFPVKYENNKITLKHDNPSKKDKKKMNSMAAHIRSMISGINKKYVYKLKICSVHFPMNVSVENDQVVIKNFQGEKTPRIAKILPGAKVEINNEEVTVESADKNKAGQTAANIERATIIRGKDRRIFQDGIYIVEKEKGKRLEDIEEEEK